MNENLKKQEQEFKSHCKEEMSRLKGQIEEVKAQTSEEDSGDKVVLAHLATRFFKISSPSLKIRLN